MPITIDNDTGQILDEAIAKLPTRAERIARYEAEMDRLLDPKNAHWPSDGQPGDMGDRVRAMLETHVDVRISNMQAAKHGGAYADAVEMQERGYAIGHFGG